MRKFKIGDKVIHKGEEAEVVYINGPGTHADVVIKRGASIKDLKFAHTQSSVLERLEWLEKKVKEMLGA